MHMAVTKPSLDSPQDRGGAVKLQQDAKLFNRGADEILEDVVSGVLRGTNEAAHAEPATTVAHPVPTDIVDALAPGPCTTVNRQDAANALSTTLTTTSGQKRKAAGSTDPEAVGPQTSTDRQRLEAALASASTIFDRRERNRIKSNLRRQLKAVIAREKGTTAYQEDLKRMTDTGTLQAHKRGKQIPRDWVHERERRVQKHIREGGTRKSYEESERQRWNRAWEKRRQVIEAAREAADAVRLQQHLEMGGTRESFISAKPMRRIPKRAAKSIGENASGAQAQTKSVAQSGTASSSEQRSESSGHASQSSSEAPWTQQPAIPPSRFPSSLSLPLHSIAHRQSTTASAVHATPSASSDHASTQQQQLPIAYPHGFLADVSQEHLAAAQPHLQPATPDQPSDINAWVDSLFVDSPE